MDATLYVPYSNGDPIKGFSYNGREIDKKTYVSMLVDAYNKYKGGIDASMRTTFTKNMSINDYEKEVVRCRQQDYYYTETEVRLLDMKKRQMSIDELISYYQSREPFVVIINMYELKKPENSDLETDMKQWMKECIELNNSVKLTTEQKITGMSKKTLKVRMKNEKSTAILKDCKMIEVFNNTTFAFLVDMVVFVTEK